MNDDYSLETCGILCKSIPWCTAFSIQQWQKEPDRRGKCWLEKNCASVKRVTNANHLGCGWWKYNRYTMKRQSNKIFYLMFKTFPTLWTNVKKKIFFVFFQFVFVLLVFCVVKRLSMIHFLNGSHDSNCVFSKNLVFHDQNAFF